MISDIDNKGSDLDCEQSLFCSKIRAGRTAKPRAASSVGGRVSSPAHATRGSRLAARGSNIALAISPLLRQGL